ncbi:MAG: cell division protein ZipA [Gammaproteobacteria bacterium]|nr:cell division protein ZipA [Gammaproteobacteria bacterium]
MDADILRLFLFLAGVALIVGIYFWDRHKKINVRINAIHKAEHHQREETEKSSARQDPVWDNDTDDALPDRSNDLSETLKELGEIVEEEGADKRSFLPLEQTTFEFDQESGPATAEKPGIQIPQKILQLNIIARDHVISGDALMRAARDLRLEQGEMDIFHHYAEKHDHAAPVFSMASLVEPGTFPFNDMGGFNTPGVTLFAQLPGPIDGIETFDQLLATGQRLAALLDAELLDETRSGLGQQRIENIREEISEHGRLVRLARS